MAITVAGEPTSLEAVISESNSSHVNVTVSWESPADPVTGYVIYYQTKGGPVISDMVSGGETETHSLDGLQRCVTYFISILALTGPKHEFPTRNYCRIVAVHTGLTYPSLDAACPAIEI